MKSDLYLYLRDRRHSNRYDRVSLHVALVLLFLAVVLFGFCLSYGVAMTAVQGFY